jgi:aminocarboxymuconate-semialdehyde decarboxylase
MRRYHGRVPPAALVFMHPAGSTLGQRLARYSLSNIIGNPLDTTIALSHLTFGGVLEMARD